jgi:hypothetical protein
VTQGDDDHAARSWVFEFARVQLVVLCCGLSCFSVLIRRANHRELVRTLGSGAGVVVGAEWYSFVASLTGRLASGSIASPLVLACVLSMTVRNRRGIVVGLLSVLSASVAAAVPFLNRASEPSGWFGFAPDSDVTWYGGGVSASSWAVAISAIVSIGFAATATLIGHRSVPTGGLLACVIALVLIAIAHARVLATVVVHSSTVCDRGSSWCQWFVARPDWWSETAVVYALAVGLVLIVGVRRPGHWVLGVVAVGAGMLGLAMA